MLSLSLLAVSRSRVPTLPLSLSMVAVDIGAVWAVVAADVEVFSGAAFWAAAAAAAKLDLE